MFARIALAAVLAAGLLVIPGVSAQAPQPGGGGPPAAALQPKAAGVGHIVRTLHEQRVAYEGNLNEVPLFELLQHLSKKYDVTFVIMEEAFRDAEQPNIREAKPNLTATRLEGVTLHRFLT